MPAIRYLSNAGCTLIFRKCPDSGVHERRQRLPTPTAIKIRSRWAWPTSSTGGRR